jgi:hypothetical protein
MQDLQQTKYNRSNITLNLLWQNDMAKPKDKQDYIFPEKQDRIHKQENIEINAFDRITAWAREFNVTIWYDSLDGTVTDEIVKNTIDKINHSMVNLKDVRQLNLVKNHPNVFSKINPVYFQVDLLRVIAAYATLQETKDDAVFIYTDFAVKPIPMLAMMDIETTNNLEQYGFVMARDSDYGHENGFHITSNKKEIMFAIKQAIIDLNICRSYSAEKSLGSGRNSLKQIVYGDYKNMLKLLYALLGKGEIKNLYKKTTLCLTGYDIIQSHFYSGFKPRLKSRVFSSWFPCDSSYNLFTLVSHTQFIQAVKYRSVYIDRNSRVIDSAGNLKIITTNTDGELVDIDGNALFKKELNTDFDKILLNKDGQLQYEDEQLLIDDGKVMIQNREEYPITMEPEDILFIPTKEIGLYKSRC